MLDLAESRPAEQAAPSVTPSADPIAPPPARPSAALKRRRSKGLPPSMIALALVAVAAVLWGLWMTKTVHDLKTSRVPIVSVRLQPLVEEFVHAQARSGASEEQIMRQMQAFMGALDQELSRLGQNGTTVLVAEAVLSKNVPEVTADLRKAVYAKVPAPAAGAGTPNPVASSMQQFMGGGSGASPAPAAPQMGGTSGGQR